jgi:hypothetical protein
MMEYTLSAKISFAISIVTCIIIIIGLGVISATMVYGEILSGSGNAARANAQISLVKAKNPGSSSGSATPSIATTSNTSPFALAIAHRLAIASVNASKTQAKLGTPCLPQLSRFILPPKEARFTVIKQCVTVTGRVVWTHYFNDDGDANFNVVLDPPYKNMLGPGSYSQVFTTKYPGGPALHMEVVCQGPVTSLSKENVGACNGYNGPHFGVLPKIGQHVMVTGRYLIEMPEMPGGITELHPVYAIKILPG